MGERRAWAAPGAKCGTLVAEGGVSCWLNCGVVPGSNLVMTCCGCVGKSEGPVENDFSEMPIWEEPFEESLEESADVLRFMFFFFLLFWLLRWFKSV